MLVKIIKQVLILILTILINDTGLGQEANNKDISEALWYYALLEEKHRNYDQALFYLWQYYQSNLVNEQKLKALAKMRYLINKKHNLNHSNTLLIDNPLNDLVYKKTNNSTPHRPTGYKFYFLLINVQMLIILGLAFYFIKNRKKSHPKDITQNSLMKPNAVSPPTFLSQKIHFSEEDFLDMSFYSDD